MKLAMFSKIFKTEPTSASAKYSSINSKPELETVAVTYAKTKLKVDKLEVSILNLMNDMNAVNQDIISYKKNAASAPKIDIDDLFGDAQPSLEQLNARLKSLQASHDKLVAERKPLIEKLQELSPKVGDLRLDVAEQQSGNRESTHMEFNRTPSTDKIRKSIVG